MSTNALKILKEKTIYGNKITSTTRITKMNLILQWLAQKMEVE